MGRKKSKPQCSVGIVLGSNDTTEQAELEEAKKNELEPYFVEVDHSSWILDDHLDISKVVLMNLNFKERVFWS